MKIPMLLICSLLVVASYSQEFTGFSTYKLGLDEKTFVKAMKIQVHSWLGVVKKQGAEYYRDYLGIGPTSQYHQWYRFEYSSDGGNWPIISWYSIAEGLSLLRDSLTIYFVPKVNIEGIALVKAFFVFYQDRLQAIEAEPTDELLKTVEEKYAVSNSVDTPYQSNCATKAGLTTHLTWRFTSSSASAWDDRFYDAHCEEKHARFLRIETDAFREMYERRSSELKAVQEWKNKVRDEAIRNAI